MTRLRIAACAALALSAAALPARASKLLGDPESIPRHAEASSGMLLAGGSFLLQATVGESAVQPVSGGSFKMDRGLVAVAAQPGSVVAITALSKATGTLELSWTAPGGDGFVGRVGAGFYRVDYSSDPLPVFAPTSFQLEFATAVAPGDAQSLVLNGLAPNTTYFTRIYLADDRKYFAEDSRRSDESTLANLAVNPVVVAVSSTHVTLSWGVPAGDAEGYQADASSTGYAGGATYSSSTADGRVVSLTMVGLTPNTTYFLRVGSLNWQRDRNYSLLIPILTTLSGTPLPVISIIGTPNALARSIALRWTRQPYLNPTGTLVVLSTSPAIAEVVGGGSFAPGQVLGDGSVVKATSTADSLVDAGLVLDTTFYYHLYGAATGPLYSIVVTTAVFLDLPPMAPAGLAGDLSPDRSKVTLTWQTTRSNLDGSLFASTAAPRAIELAQYDIERSTSLFGANFVSIATVSAASLAFVDTVPDPLATYLYRVKAVDSFKTTDRSMAVSSDGDLYIFSDDQITHIRVPRRYVPELAAAQILLKGVDEPVDGTNGVFRAVRFQGTQAPLGRPADRFQFSASAVDLVLRYDVAGGRVVPSRLPLRAAAPGAPAAAPQGLYPDIPLAQADQNLSLYWDDGSKFVKMFGSVDTSRQLVSMKTALAGTYQIRSLLRDQGFSFDLSTLSNRIITPNGDGLNDAAIFRFDNPRDSAFSGRIFDLSGGAVANMTAGPVANSLQWDGKANGRPVSGGVYVYQIQGEGKTFTGTLLVIQ